MSTRNLFSRLPEHLNCHPSKIKNVYYVIINKLLLGFNSFYIGSHCRVIEKNGRVLIRRYKPPLNTI